MEDLGGFAGFGGGGRGGFGRGFGDSGGLAEFTDGLLLFVLAGVEGLIASIFAHDRRIVVGVDNWNCEKWM